MKLLPSNRYGYRAAVSTATLLVSVCLLQSQCVQAAETADPCAALSGKTTAMFHEAKACLDHFSFDQARADQTIETVRKIVNDLYVFNEIAASPPQIEGLSAVKVDISYGLDVIQHDTWHSDREFQEAIALLLDKVHDAHLAYSPFCYRQFVFWQPIQLNSLVRDQRSVVNVAYIKDDIWPEAKSSWVGCEVTHIDGGEALDMIMDYAVNNNGESKDVNTCYNNIMNTKSYFHGWDDGADDLGYHRFVPAQEFHSYTLRCPKKGAQSDAREYDEPFTVKVPWVAQIPTGFSDADSYWKNFCQSAHASLDKRANAASHVDVDELNLIRTGKAFGIAPATAMNAADSSNDGTGKYVQFIPLEGENAKVGIIDIQSFSIAISDRQTFVDEFHAGLADFEKRGIEKIILDLSSNGGGDACAGEFIINTFFQSTPNYPSDVKYSPFLERVIKKAYEVQATKWIDYQSVDKKTNDSARWFTDTVEYQRGEKKVRFSQSVSLSCNTWNDDLNGIHDYKNTRYTDKDILILSDGRCGSTCAIVASRLRLSHGVPAMGLGGIRGNRMQFASFPGGESERLSSFLMDLQALNMQDDPDAPAPFPTRADMGWTFREVYRPLRSGETFSGNERELLEYSVNNADCRLYFTDDNANDVKKLWAEVAKVLLSGQCTLQTESDH